MGLKVLRANIATPANINAQAEKLDRAKRIYREILYPKELWWFLASFIFLVSISRLLSYLAVRLTHRRSNGSGSRTNNLKRASFIRLPTALVNLYRIVAFRSTVNFGVFYSLNLAEVFLTASYIAALSIWTLVNTTDYKGIKLMPDLYSDRLGTLAASQITLITCLGTKNNVIGWITGLSFEKLNYLHRMTARALLILAWVHGGMKITWANKHTRPSGKKGFDGLTHIPWLLAGIIGISALTLLCLLSLRPVRAKAYEFFFFAHFVLALIFLIGAYVHVNNFESFRAYVWPSFLIWGLDRFIRTVRLVAFNTGGQKVDASTELVSENIVRLTVPRPSYFCWAPGQLAYLTIPAVSSIPFESHPFTIGSIDPKLLSHPETENSSGANTWRKGDLKDLVFIVHAKTGMTNRLLDVAAKGQKLKVLVEGPYGASPNLDYFETVVLIAGSSGVTFTLPNFQNVIERVRIGRSDCRKLVFIWAVRETEHLDWISRTLTSTLQSIPANLSVSVRLFITNKDSSNLSVYRNLEDETPVGSDDGKEFDRRDFTPDTTMHGVRVPNLVDMKCVQVAPGRPDVKGILVQAAREARGRMNVTVCGSGIVRPVRSALRSSEFGPGSILRGGPDVSLHVEAFGYA